MLYSIGAFATRSHPVTRTAPLDQARIHLEGLRAAWVARREARGDRNHSQLFYARRGEVTDEMRQQFTRVLQGHIAIDRVRFPKGTAGIQLAYRTGITEDLYDCISKWFGHLPGGIAVSAVLSNAAYGAVTGSSIASVATLGRPDAVLDISTDPKRGQWNSEARIVLDALPGQPIPALVSFVAPKAQFTPREVETRTEREKMLFGACGMSGKLWEPKDAQD